MTTFFPRMHTIPQLASGDRLTRREFHRRYAAMPHCKKAELVEGTVYMPSPVSHSRHAAPHARLLHWLATYATATTGLDYGDNATVLLDLANELQPDAHLRIARGGACRINADGYLEGPPELVAEIAASSASYDLHDKFRAYQRNGVREYLVWRVDDAAIDWFSLREERFVAMQSDAHGVLRSEMFPGLWLDVPAMLGLDLRAAIERLSLGIASAEHRAFVAELALRTSGS